MRACVGCYLLGVATGVAFAPVAWLAGHMRGQDSATAKAERLIAARDVVDAEVYCNARLVTTDADAPWSCTKPDGHPLGHLSSAGHIWR